MVKVNDKVYHVYNISRAGTVVEIKQGPSRTYMSAGPSQGQLLASVRLADGRIVPDIPVGDLMRND
jgi:hypothetical protein